MNTSNQNISNFWKANSSLLTKVVAGILLLLALYILAKLVWLWVDYSKPKLAQQSIVDTNKNVVKSKVNVNKIVQMHLFGQADVVEKVDDSIAGETPLNLKLLGVYVDSDDKLSSAIIRSGAEEKVYWVGDELRGVGSRKVELKKVEPLRVIIRNSGRNETLTLLEQLNKQVLNSAAKPKEVKSSTDGKTIDKRRDSRLSKDLADIRSKLTQSPQSYADLAKFEMVTDNTGQVSGFKVAPGKDPRMFSRLGLRRNDVVTSINGQALSNQAYWTMLEQLQTAETLEVNIERNGEPITLLLNLGAESTGQSNNRPSSGNRELSIQ